MKLRELVNEILIDPRKLTAYALDPENPKGKNKAFMFEKYLGYTKDNYQPLLDQIYFQALDAEAIPQNTDQYGTRYQIDLQIQGIESEQIEIVRTGWLIAPQYFSVKECRDVPWNVSTGVFGSKQVQLATIYIPKRS
ncbi:hypothetical protein VB711_04315 [Cronbergia sp. UHCC 0137]|uniref:DUF6883 domain-containing protein n=1 Tax=Cronbergia sp. UHCC 0137 TaxID=3110239 RepID=UPI002B21B5A7|nr:DUF6883 domain-containing protein [Cronbergia sp. UHCC 0137]MEA5617066.1 hypothetical protein [Cronbergia sp. UHCC 0137]